jgi:hypothetical protein
MAKKIEDTYKQGFTQRAWGRFYQILLALVIIGFIAIYFFTWEEISGSNATKIVGGVFVLLLAYQYFYVISTAAGTADNEWNNYKCELTNDSRGKTMQGVLDMYKAEREVNIDRQIQTNAIASQNNYSRRSTPSIGGFLAGMVAGAFANS